MWEKALLPLCCPKKPVFLIQSHYIWTAKLRLFAQTQARMCKKQSAKRHLTALQPPFPHKRHDPPCYISHGKAGRAVYADEWQGMAGGTRRHRVSCQLPEGQNSLVKWKRMCEKSCWAMDST